MTTTTHKIELTFIEPTLATTPGDRDVATRFVASRSADAEKIEEELGARPADDAVEDMSTVFPRDATGLFAWDYQLRGFFKEKLYGLIELGECKLSKWTYKKAVDLFLFVNPRRCYYERDGARILAPDGRCQRSLRATTLRGDRVCLAISEQLNAGCVMRFEVKLLSPPAASKSRLGIGWEDLEKCLEYGQLHGFSQWRNASYGRFTWRQVGETAVPKKAA